MKTNKQIVASWVAAFNKNDIGSLMNLYAEGATHVSPHAKKSGLKGGLVPANKLQNFWAGALNNAKKEKLHFKLNQATVSSRYGGDVKFSYTHKPWGEENKTFQNLRLIIDEGKILFSQTE